MCRYVSPASEIRVEIQMKSGHSFWAKDRQTTEAIDLKDILDGYWSSGKPEFTVSSQ